MDDNESIRLHPDREISAEAGAADFGLAEILAGHFNVDAHLGQAGAHTVADAVAESLLAGGALSRILLVP